MIQANELRIGNWVIVNDRLIKPDAPREPYFYQISGFDLYKVDENGDNENGISGILITPEILIAAGATKDSWRYYIGDFLWSDVNKTLCWKAYRLDHIEYVHQFQNAHFALTGTELTIKL